MTLYSLHHSQVEIIWALTGRVPPPLTSLRKLPSFILQLLCSAMLESPYLYYFKIISQIPLVCSKVWHITHTNLIPHSNSVVSMGKPALQPAPHTCKVCCAEFVIAKALSSAGKNAWFRMVRYFYTCVTGNKHTRIYLLYTNQAYTSNLRRFHIT